MLFFLELAWKQSVVYFLKLKNSIWLFKSNLYVIKFRLFKENTTTQFHRTRYVGLLEVPFTAQMLANP